MNHAVAGAHFLHALQMLHHGHGGSRTHADGRHGDPLGAKSFCKGDCNIPFLVGDIEQLLLGSYLVSVTGMGKQAVKAKVRGFVQETGQLDGVVGRGINAGPVVAAVYLQPDRDRLVSAGGSRFQRLGCGQVIHREPQGLP
ncbi:hypothetical protein ES703_45072 [subsurface metagenome]